MLPLVHGSTEPALIRGTNKGMNMLRHNDKSEAPAFPVFKLHGKKMD
jgi:hypothetical protein